MGVVDACECSDICEVPNLRKQQNIKARAHAYLGWSFSRLRDKKDSELNARNHYQAALECEPKNPYYLADVLGYEIYCTRNRELAGSMRATIAEAIQTCREHALRNTEMPYACFTAGRLSLLLGSCADPEKPEKARKLGYEALGWYARGVHHYLSATHVVPAEALEYEVEWMQKVNAAVALPEQYSWSHDLLQIAGAVKRQPSKTKNKPNHKKDKKLNIVKPVLIIAGGAASMAGDSAKGIRPLLLSPLKKFKGTVISGGTAIGVPGCVGNIAAELNKTREKKFKLLGYVTKRFTTDAPEHKAYDKVDKFGAVFSPEHVLRGWKDILAANIKPEEVMLLGFGGGPLSAAEYQIGVALGASVGVVIRTGGAADELAGDPLWGELHNFFPLPEDWSTIRAFIIPAKTAFGKKVLEDMGMSFHERYVDGSANRLPANMRPWEKLDETYRKASCEQARYSIEILKAAGFDVRKARVPVILKFTKGERRKIEQMAELEHGRWNVERLRAGWRFGKFRDDLKQIHNYIVPWRELPADIKPFDRNSVKAFPEILKKAGFEIYRLDVSATGNDTKKR
jgi:hypothetical protein